MDRLPEDFLQYKHSHHLSKKTRTGLIIVVSWLVLTIVLLSVSLGTIRQNIRRYESMSAVSVESGFAGDVSEDVDIFFISPTLQFQKYSITFPSSGRSFYHTSLNALLSGPPSPVLRDGAISLINPDTELLGFSLSENTAFVNLSSEFLQSADFISDNLFYPKKQIEMTLKNINPEIENIVFLINGQLL